MKRLLLLALIAAPLCANETKRLDTFKKNLANIGYTALTTATGIGQLAASLKTRISGRVLFGAFALNSFASLYRAVKNDEFSQSATPFVDRVHGPLNICVAKYLLEESSNLLTNPYSRVRAALLSKTPESKTTAGKLFNSAKRSAILASPTIMSGFGLALGAYGIQQMISGNTHYRW